MKSKTRRMKVKQDFALSRANYRSWSDDVAASVLPWFQQVNQTPLLALGKTVGESARRAIMKSFRKQRERVTITSTIPHTAHAVAADLTVVKSSCKTCGQPSKELVSRIAFFVGGKSVKFEGKPRATVVLCPACGAASEGPVEGPQPMNLDELPGSYDVFLQEVDSL